MKTKNTRCLVVMGVYCDWRCGVQYAQYPVPEGYDGQRVSRAIGRCRQDRIPVVNWFDVVHGGEGYLPLVDEYLIVGIGYGMEVLMNLDVLVKRGKVTLLKTTFFWCSEIMGQAILNQIKGTSEEERKKQVVREALNIVEVLKDRYCEEAPVSVK